MICVVAMYDKRLVKMKAKQEGVLWPIDMAGADGGNRTHVCSLGSCRSAIELHPHFVSTHG